MAPHQWSDIDGCNDNWYENDTVQVIITDIKVEKFYHRGSALLILVDFIIFCVCFRMIPVDGGGASRQQLYSIPICILRGCTCIWSLIINFKWARMNHISTCKIRFDNLSCWYKTHENHNDMRYITQLRDALSFCENDITGTQRLLWPSYKPPNVDTPIKKHRQTRLNVYVFSSISFSSIVSDRA